MTGTSWSLLVALDTFEKVSFQGVEIEDLLAGRPRWGGSRPRRWRRRSETSLKKNPALNMRCSRWHAFEDLLVSIETDASGPWLMWSSMKPR